MRLWQDTFGSVALIVEFRVTLYYGCFSQGVNTGSVDNSPYTHTLSTWLLWQASTFWVLVTFSVLPPDLGSHHLGIHSPGHSAPTALLLFCNGLVVSAELHLALPSLPFLLFSLLLPHSDLTLYSQSG